MKQLFTNVPLTDAIKVSVDELYEIRKPNVEKNYFIKLIKMATSEYSLVSIMKFTIR